MVNRSFVAILFCVLLAACNRAPQDEAAVREALRQHLSQNAGLDMNALDMDITDLKFEGNTARANVAFKPKAAPADGMRMSYTLERRGDKWVVQGRGAGHGGSMGGGGAMGGGGIGGTGKGDTQAPQGQLPAGHPPVSGDKAASGELPAGHPPVGKQKSQTPATK